jgi:hypothetical protein
MARRHWWRGIHGNGAAGDDLGVLKDEESRAIRTGLAPHEARLK